jgi:hypothetical protein
LIAIAGSGNAVTGLIVSGVSIVSWRLQDNRRFLLDRKPKKKHRIRGRNKAAYPKNPRGEDTMRKIVIISQQGFINHDLVALLTVLFPECDICIAEADAQAFEPYPAGSFSKADMKDKT